RAEHVQIVTQAEATAHGAQRSPGSKTWHFTARNVRDVAWAASPDFRWDASGWHGILIQTFYRAGAAPWEDANKMAWFTIKHFSETWGTYPWPHATTVEGLVEGMEYPMLTFVPSIEKREDQFWVLTHEFGHEWFPMMVGSDERRYPWMDEGFNTFIDYGSAEGYFKGTAYGDTVRRDLLSAARISAVPGNEQPLIDKPVEQHDLAWAAYQKPALMLMVLPVTLELRYADGTAETRDYPIEMWNLGSRFIARVPTSKPVVGVVIDPRKVYPDIDQTNNRWGR